MTFGARVRGRGLGLTACLALGACAVPSHYAGIELRPGAAASDLQELARRAQAGDKQAQLDLGIRFEEGTGVERDLGRAVKLYRQSAAKSGGPIWAYSPAVGNGTKGRLIQVNSSEITLGLVEAEKRLANLNHIKSVRRDK